MALTFPYPLDFLADCLCNERVAIDLRRNDEMSGSGDGRYWSANLAPPLWTASMALYAHSEDKAREINAKVWALDGMAKPFLWGDPHYKGPASGVTAGLGSVTVSGVSADRGSMSIEGLPVGFAVTPGDYFSISHASGTRRYFGVFVEGATANSAGAIPLQAVRPYVPMGITFGTPVELVRPCFKAIVTEYQPFTSTRWNWGDGASIKLLQRP